MHNAALSVKTKGLLGGFRGRFAWISGKRSLLKKRVRKHHLLRSKRHLTDTLISNFFDVSILAPIDVRCVAGSHKFQPSPLLSAEKFLQPFQDAQLGMPMPLKLSSSRATHDLRFLLAALSPCARIMALEGPSLQLPLDDKESDYHYIPQLRD